MMEPPPDKNGGGGGEGIQSTFGIRRRSSSPPPSENSPQQEQAGSKEQQEEQQPQPKPPPRPVLRGSGSYPSMIRARTANRNKITKRNSESSVILTGGGSSKSRPTVGSSASDSKKRRHHHPLHKKKSVYSRATRRKSLENLGLVVRNRCGTAKLQWPSEKKETDIFDLLPEGCLQVRQLRLKSPKQDEPPELFRGPGERGGWKSSQESSFPSRGDSLNPASQESHHESLGTPPKTDWKNKRNISVIVRIRPKQSRELDEKSIVFRTDSRTIVFDPKEKTKDFYFQGVKQSTRNDFGRKRPNRNVYFHYDKVYGPESTNRHIFHETLQDLTDHLIEGFNSTVFAYGATGSGKTYTMIGSNSNPGLIVLMVEMLYKRIDELAGDYECDVACSYLEVYNETIKDLLKPEKELYIREDGKKGIIIPELTFYKPRGPTELLKLLRNGNRARTQHATDLNAESSRSHAVFEVKLCLRKRSKKNEGGDHFGDGLSPDDEYFQSSEEDGLHKVEVIQSKLVMVDLAGSERGTAATASSANAGGFFMDTGARQREGSSINKSLLALANCISALADGKCHIPYRNSKLTRLLKDALSGNCTTVMIANISPSSLTSEDTYNTLKYADRAKNIVGPGTKQRNVFLEDLLMEDCSKNQVSELQAKVIYLSELLEGEKLKNERMQERLQKKEDLNSLNSNTRIKDGMRTLTNHSMLGGGDADGIHHCMGKVMENGVDDDLEKICRGEDGYNKEFHNSGSKNNAVTEDQLPTEIQRYMQLIKKRATVYSDYVQFASESRLGEWTASCKKLKADMADFLGRLPASNENYVSFCKLKNEVNHIAMASRSSSSSNFDEFGEKNSFHNNPPPPPPHIQQRKYAIKLKNLTEKLELVRLECVAKNLLSLPDGAYMAESLSPHLGHGKLPNDLPPPPSVAISLEEFLQFKRLLGEQEGNDKMEQFYHIFSQHINNQLITSGMTLMHALKLYKKLESLKGKSDGEDDVSANIQQEFKELSDFVYGPGSEVNSLDGNNNSLQAGAGRPQTSVNHNLGRRSNSILEDLLKLKKAVEQPLLIQLTTLLADEDEEIETEIELLDKRGNENSSHEINAGNQNQTYPHFNNSNNRRKSYSASGGAPSPRMVQEPPMTIAGLGGNDEEGSSSYNNNADIYEEDYQTDYHHNLSHHSTNPIIADNQHDDSTRTPAQVETELTAEESSSKETIPHSDPELYESSRPETEFIKGCPSLPALQEQPSRRKRRTWNTTETSVACEHGGLMISTPSAGTASQLSLPSRGTSTLSNNNPSGNSYNGKEGARKSKSHSCSVMTKCKDKPNRERESQSQHNSDYDWCTTSTGTTSTSESCSGTATTSSSVSTSVENITKRELNANNPSQMGSGQQRKEPSGIKKRLAGPGDRLLKEIQERDQEQTQQISGMGQLGKSGQDPEVVLSFGDKSLNPKYTYRLESPSEVMQAFSAAFVQSNSNEAEEGSSNEEEDDDDDDSSTEVSGSSSVVNREKVSAGGKNQMHTKRDNR